MLRQYSPMLCNEVKNDAEIPELLKTHITAPKFDGTRELIYIENGKIRTENRRKFNTTHLYPELQEALKHINARNAVLDAEFCCFTNGYPDFQKLQKRSHLTKPVEIQLRSKQYPIQIVTFDLLYYDGADYTKKPLTERQTKLKEIIKTNDTIAVSQEVKITLEQFITFWKTIKKDDLEGVVFKRSDSTYEEKRSDSWLKYKNKKTKDLVIERYEETTGEKGNAGLVIYSTYKGNEIKVAVNKHTDRHLIKNTPATKKLIAEVEYLGETNNGHLRQPTCKQIYILEK